MIITKLKGGLGNQMFQYAMGLAVASKNNEELKLDATGYDDIRYINADTPRQYRLFPFNISGSVSAPEEVSKLRNPFGIFSKALRFFKQRILKKYYIDYNPSFFKKNHKYIEGYFQSEKNFLEVKDKIIKEFTLKKEFESEEFLMEKNKILGVKNDEDVRRQQSEDSNEMKSVSVHIRRGDYINDEKTKNFHGICFKEYYEKAMEIIKSKIDLPIFYFFSDDIEWVKKEYGMKENFVFVSNGKLQDYEELILMSSCTHNIIANSSFSWWGAWLNQNKNKIVIAPKKWVNIEPNPQPNIIPEGWVVVES